jgi:gamma-glutamylputrescine oxidase
MLLDSDTQLNQRSYYEASVQRPALCPALQGEVRADVLVVGGGFAGLSAAIELARKGYRVALLEADRVGSGASGRNGGQAIVGYASGQDPFEVQLGKPAAKLAWQMSLQAIELIDERIRDFDIDCDRVKGYLYVADSQRKARQLAAEVQRLQDDCGFACDLATGFEVQRHIHSPRYVASAFDTTSGHLHPLKFALGLLAAAQLLGVQVYERTPLVQLQRGDTLLGTTPQGLVRAKFVVLAGNCTLPEYGPQVAPELAARVMPVGTYMIATEPLGLERCRSLIASNAAVCDNNFILDYFRFSADHRLLFGGEVSYSTRTPRKLKEHMAARMARVFPVLAGVPVEFVWGGFVDISMNRAPDFGRLGANVYYLQGFSGHGVALTGLAGQLVAQAIAGQAERFDVFAKLQHARFPGGPLLRTPSLVLGMAWHRMLDVL